ncbi:MAG TPA: GPW/gp25 family protein [Gemmatimonadota bacterium]|nr:GPW/gp25 family protein [Gemmatimonadota bacterium]
MGLRLTPSGSLAMVEGDDSVRQALLLLLSTAPGERVMRPRYGCDLRRLAFSPIDDTAAGLAVHYVRQAVERWEPRVEIVRLDATPHASEPGRLDVFLEYRVRATRRLAEIRFGLDLTGEEA